MAQTTQQRASELMADKEYGHELTPERALRLAQEEANEEAQRLADEYRERELLDGFRRALIAAGVAPQSAKTLADRYLDLPDMIQSHRLQFSDAYKAAAVTAAIRNLYAALGFGEPDLTPIDLQAERKRKHQPWIQFPG